MCNVFICIKKLRKLPAFSTFHYTGISRIGFCETLKIFQKFLVTNFSGLTTVIYPRSTQKLFVWKLERNIHFFQRDHNCVKNARMQIFADLYFLVNGQNFRFSHYTGRCSSAKTCILGYFTQCAEKEMLDFLDSKFWENGIISDTLWQLFVNGHKHVGWRQFNKFMKTFFFDMQ